MSEDRSPFDLEEVELPPGSPFETEAAPTATPDDDGDVVNGYTEWRRFGDLMAPDGSLILPGGIWIDGKRVRRVELGEWTGFDDRWIAGLRKLRGITPFLFLRGLLGRFLRSVGSERYDEPKRDEAPKKMTRARMRRESRIADLMWGDVMFLLFALRALEVDEEVRWTGLRCDHCGHEFDYTTPIDGLPVRVIADGIEDEDALPFEVDLPAGRGGRRWKIDGRPVEALRMRPARFVFMDRVRAADGEANVGQVEESMRAESLVSGCRPEDLAGAPRRVLIAVDDAIGARNPGPRIAIRDACPECSTPFARVIDWSFDVFFRGGSNR